MFGLGGQEILLLVMLGCGFVAVAFFFKLMSSRGAGSRIVELEDENRRLREKLDRKRDRNEP